MKRVTMTIAAVLLFGLGCGGEEAAPGWGYGGSLKGENGPEDDRWGEMSWLQECATSAYCNGDGTCIQNINTICSTCEAISSDAEAAGKGFDLTVNSCCTYMKNMCDDVATFSEVASIERHDQCDPFWTSSQYLCSMSNSP
jgi:hypothetical protein